MTLKASELMEELKRSIDLHGDLPVAVLQGSYWFYGVTRIIVRRARPGEDKDLHPQFFEVE